MVEAHKGDFEYRYSQFASLADSTGKMQLAPTILDTTSAKFKVLVLTKIPPRARPSHAVYATTKKNTSHSTLFNTEDIYQSLCEHPDRNIRRWPKVVSAATMSKLKDPALFHIEHRGMDTISRYKGMGWVKQLYRLLERMIGPAQQEASQRFGSLNFLMSRGLYPHKLHVPIQGNFMAEIPINTPELVKLVYDYIESPVLRTSTRKCKKSHNFATPFWVEMKRKEKPESLEGTYPGELLDELVHFSVEANEALLDRAMKPGSDGEQCMFFDPDFLGGLAKNLSDLAIPVEDDNGVTGFVTRPNFL